MIDLKINITGKFKDHSPFVLKLTSYILENPSDTAGIFAINGSSILVECPRGKFTFKFSTGDSFENDICLIFPEKSVLIRLIREGRVTNTIMLTEQCDQACIMCSQPPKNKIYDFYDLYKSALTMCEKDSIIGISGGEPTLEKDSLFKFLLEIQSIRPDIKFHILTNAQHFNENDIKTLSSLNDNILWGVPLYSHLAKHHDEVVGKIGAFDRLLVNLNVLFRSGAHVELRTVVLEQNHKDMPQLAEFISLHLPLCETWAIMQLENIGYARMNWDHIFVDTSTRFAGIANALSIAKIKDINARLYNFPKCTIPKEWQSIANKSISDWKNKYLKICASCNEKPNCCGFFDWYNEAKGFSKLEAL